MAVHSFCCFIYNDNHIGMTIKAIFYGFAKKLKVFLNSPTVKLFRESSPHLIPYWLMSACIEYDAASAARSRKRPHTASAVHGFRAPGTGGFSVRIRFVAGGAGPGSAVGLLWR
jgi:hypothetical protein